MSLFTFCVIFILQMRKLGLRETIITCLNHMTNAKWRIAYVRSTIQV